MSSYFIAQIYIHDKNEYEKYLDGFDDIFTKYKGKVVVADDKSIVLEGKWQYSRIIVIRFPNDDEAKRWYFSTEYRELVKHRHKASNAIVLLATGRD